MNQQQCNIIMSATCYLLDSTDGIEYRLRSAGIKEKELKKVKKALDLIYEVNQTYSEIKTKLVIEDY